MADRTIRLHGIGFDETPATLQIDMDGVNVFNNVVYTTADAPTYDVNAYMEDILDNPVYSMTKDHTYTGDIAVSMTATKGDFLFTNARSNWMPISHTDTPTDFFTSGDEGYINCHYSDYDGGVSRDPNSNVVIDGVAKTADHAGNPNARFGQWYWYVPETKTMTFTMNISTGLITPEVIGVNELAAATYTGDGANRTFAIPSYAGGKSNRVYAFINDVEVTTPGAFTSDVESTTITFDTDNTPADGASVAVKRLEKFDDSFTTYANFEVIS